MGNTVSKEGLTNAEVSGYDQDFLKKQVENLKIARPIPKSRTPNENQYDKDSAYGIVAYRNQNPDSKSDLDLARLNFEKKYESFLNWYGQYSNTVIKDTNNKSLTYPVSHFFDGYGWGVPSPKVTMSPTPNPSPSPSYTTPSYTTPS
jgi:hypothetical protein